MTDVIELSETTTAAEANKQEGYTRDVNEFVLELVRDKPEDWDRCELDCGLCESTGLVEWLYNEKTGEADRDLVNDCIFTAVREAFCRAISIIVREECPSVAADYDERQKRPGHPKTVEDVTRMIEDERGGVDARWLIDAVENYIHADT